MEIFLGLHFDGQRGRLPVDRVGFVALGPLGLLNVLETHLGLTRELPDPATRIAQYRDCLQRCDRPDAFYHRSFATDPLGTAAKLLEWRDLWRLHGWDGAFDAARSSRLRDLQAVEALAARLVAPGIGERLENVLMRMAAAQSPIERIVLSEPLETFPVRWRQVLAKLPCEAAKPETQSAATGGFLAELQACVRAASHGQTAGKLAWRDDGTVVVAQAETRLVAGRWLAGRIRQTDGTGLVVAPPGDASLEDLLRAGGEARLGLDAGSVCRPSLQLLPLMNELLWDPVDLNALMQFLTHPVCPVPRYARMRIADKLSVSPGIGGEKWDAVMADIRDHYADDADKVLETVARWVRHERHPLAEGAPIAEVLTRARLLADFFRARLDADDEVVRLSSRAGYAQVAAFVDALEALRDQGQARVHRRQLQRLAAFATGPGTGNGLSGAEAGALMLVTHPAAAVDAADHVFWWQLQMPAMPSGYPWSVIEMDDLASHGVRLPAVADLLERDAADWLKPLMAARRQLVLVLPPPGEDVHPLWQLLESLVDKVPVLQIEDMLARSMNPLPMAPVGHRPLPVRRRWWALPADTPVPRRAKESFSSLEKFLLNPSHWVLQYPARLNPSSILAVSDDFRVFGNVAHSLVERFYRRPDALAVREHALREWYDEAFGQVVSEEGATLLMEGRRTVLEKFRVQLWRALHRLHEQIVRGEFVSVKTEMKLDGHYAGGELTGYADLVLTDARGRQVVVDMKWAGKKYRDRLAQNQHLQLAIYARLLDQQSGQWPAVAYYIMDQATLLTKAPGIFPDAVVVGNESDETTAQLWARLVETWKWRDAQLNAGQVEVALEGIAADETSVPPEDGITLETMNPNYNDYRVLAGWEAQQ